MLNQLCVTAYSVVVVTFSCALPLHADETKTNRLNSDRLHRAVQLQEPLLDESSGLAHSNRAAGHWWSHNDSGGKPQLFAFDAKGNRTGQVRLAGTKATDWEDMASYTINGRNRVLAADCGDNLAKRSKIRLYLFDEPDPKRSTTIDDFQELTVTYSDGPRNCEAVAVDTDAKKIIMIEKATLPIAGIYELPLPDAPAQDKYTQADVVAKRVGTLNVPMISAMDRDSKNGDLWVINYFQAFHFRCSGSDEGAVGILQKTPTAFDLPKWKQIEAVAINTEHQVWLTSEGKFAPLGQLKTGDQTSGK